MTTSEGCISWDKGSWILKAERKKYVACVHKTPTSVLFSPLIQLRGLQMAERSLSEILVRNGTCELLTTTSIHMSPFLES